MLICCPECQFERTIESSQIPPSAVMATCPQCQCRFRFRNADGTPTADQTSVTPPATPEDTLAPVAEATDTPEQPTPSDGAPQQLVPEEATPEPSEEDGDDPLPPGAVIPNIPGEKAFETRSDKREQRGSASGSSDTDTPFLKKPLRKTDDLSATDVLKDGFLKLKQKLTGQADTSEQKQDAPFGQDKPNRLQDKQQPEMELGVPWEQPRRYSALMGLYQTILRVMFNAPRFFSGLASSGTGLLRPLFFYMLLGLFQTLVERMWYLMRLEAAEPSITDPQVQEMIANLTQSMSLPLTLLLSPAFLAMQLCFFAAVFFLMLRLVHPENVHFRTVFKVIAYSSAPTLVCVVPLVGPFVGSIWFGVCCFIGCKYALRLPWTRTALALGPLYLIALAVGLQLVRQVMGG